MATCVPHDKICASACALIWLAGKPRCARLHGHIGFHGIYDPTTLQQGVAPNALLGNYLGSLGFSYQATLWIITPQPDDMNWLTDKTASELGIGHEFLGDINAAREFCQRYPFAGVCKNPDGSLKFS